MYEGCGGRNASDSIAVRQVKSSSSAMLIAVCCCLL